MIVLNEYELSAPIYIWEPLLYNNKNNIKLDIYYCENGFPKDIHDNYGADAINEFRIKLIEKIKENNNCNDIWRISSDAFAILYNKNNCGYFIFKYKKKKIKILKKTIQLKVI